MPPKLDEDERPITRKTVIAWATATIAIAGALLSASLYVSGIRTDVELQGRDVQNHAEKIAELTGKTNTLGAQLNEMNTRLGEAVLILRRLDERANKP